MKICIFVKILHVLLVRGFGAGKPRQMEENSQLRGIWENPVFPNAILAPSLGLPVLVSHELHNWICRLQTKFWLPYGQGANLQQFFPVSEFHMENWQVCQIFQSTACMADKGILKIINCFSWHWIHPWFPTFCTDRCTLTLQSPSQSCFRILSCCVWSGFAQINGCTAEEHRSMSCSKSHFFPGAVQYKSASALSSISCDRIYSVFKAWLCLSTNHPLSEEPGSFLLETLMLLRQSNNFTWEFP